MLDHAEVKDMLTKLTVASRKERYWRPRDAQLRREAEDDYRNADIWLEEHHIRHVYDETQRCYVEVCDAN